MSGLLELQTALYDVLTGDTGLSGLLATYEGGPAVFDGPPQVEDPSDNSMFPYVVIGADSASPFDTDTETGMTVTATIDVWSRAEEFAEAKTIMAAIYGLLHRQDFTISGYTLVGCDLEFEETLRDPDGETRHGVQRYRIVYEG